jgi:1,4-dihydroxy-2-naphthoate octaprenyltransferase
MSQAEEAHDLGRDDAAESGVRVPPMSSPSAEAQLPREERALPARRAVEAPASPRSLWVDLLMYPTHTLPTAAVPVIVGAGLALHDGVLAPLPMLVGFIGSWAIHVAGVFSDNHELLRRHPHVLEHPELTHAVRAGTLKLSRLRAAVAVAVALALLTAPYLYAIGGSPVLAFGAIGIAASLGYHGRPWAAYVRTGLADPVFVVMFGLVGVVGTYYIGAAAVHGVEAPWALLRSLPLRAFVVGLPGGAIVASVMVIDDLRDHEFDRAKGWRTAAVRWGPDFSRAEITALVTFAYAAPVAFWLGLGFDAWVLLPLASLPLALRILDAVWSLRHRTELIPWTPRMAKLAAVHSALLATGVALSR